jgi:hypothetical protein
MPDPECFWSGHDRFRACFLMDRVETDWSARWLERWGELERPGLSPGNVVKKENERV